MTEDFENGTLETLNACDVVLLNYSSRWNYADHVQTLILRGTEWAATGKVTLPVLEEAKDYPTKP